MESAGRLENVEWDKRKNELNKARHGIDFEDAQYIYSDPNRLERIDLSMDNVSGEERWQTVGKVGDVLLVVYTERGQNKRLITARKANKRERKNYYGYYNVSGDGWSRTT